MDAMGHCRTGRIPGACLRSGPSVLGGGGSGFPTIGRNASGQEPAYSHRTGLHLLQSVSLYLLTGASNGIAAFGSIPARGSGIDAGAGTSQLNSMDIQVEGMSCQHCVKSVTEAVKSVASEASVDVSLDSGVVRIDGASEEQRPAIQDAIVDQGYEIAAG
ncbi:MAG: hypothetical protein CMN76_00255 [Spirochaetaceae bacterium]|nr:hypothetical protein [Spirochaetaceae bacterium]